MIFIFYFFKKEVIPPMKNSFRSTIKLIILPRGGSFYFPLTQKLSHSQIRANVSPSTRSAAATHTNTRQLILSICHNWVISIFYISDSYYSQHYQTTKKFGIYCDASKIFSLMTGQRQFSTINLITLPALG